MMFLSVFYATAQDTTTSTIDNEIHVNWQSSFEDAVLKAKKEHKPILIYFTGSDWCGPCMQLDKKLFHTQKFADFSDENLVLYTADYPRNGDLVSLETITVNKQLSKKYNQSSFPTLLVIGENGKLLGKKEGAYLASYYYPFFEQVVNDYNK